MSENERNSLIHNAIGKLFNEGDVEKVRQLAELLKTTSTSTIDLTHSVGGNGFSSFCSYYRCGSIITEVRNGRETLDRWFGIKLPLMEEDLRKWGIDSTQLTRLAALASNCRRLDESIEEMNFVSPSGVMYFANFGVMRNREGQYAALISYGRVSVTKAKQYFLATRSKSNLFSSSTWNEFVAAPSDSAGWTDADRKQLNMMMKVRIGTQLVDLLTNMAEPVEEFRVPELRT
eukprot:NODE_6573_length_869_cov_83.591153_g5977_i0.p1 GENE.NODE_6573_length_869_cov_83.591153_g5977_i0~~NODE_6573_length_869_cov_83.591153_g5977_i0.p1  ORF type:complete len:232 (+),score=29.22 NODE_6573_length_869_cov_83.591153_g5977_i0:56-751(+)